MTTSGRARLRAADVVPLPVRRWSAADIAAGVRGGDEAAAREMVLRYGPDVRRVVCRIVGSTAELEDVLHETFLRALERIPTLRKPERFKSWLLGIAIRVAREQQRERYGRVRLADEELPEVATGPADDEGAAALRRVEQLLAALPHDERVAFALRHLEGMDLRDAAEAAGCSLATFKRRLRRGSDRFESLAAEDPILGPRISGGTRFGGAST